MIGPGFGHLLPDELKATDQWIVWRREVRKGKLTKVPYDSRSHAPGSVTDPTIYLDFRRALDLACADQSYEGIGFVVAESDPYVGVDLDQCLDEVGSLAAWAQPVVESLASYTEITPSGRGVRVWVKGRLPPKGRKKSKLGDDGSGAIEFYSWGRFFTVTGDQFAGSSALIHERQAELDAVHAGFWPAKPTEADRPRPVPAPLAMSDREILERMFRSRNGDKIRALFDGHRSDLPLNSEGQPGNEHDLALCQHLASWTGGDLDAIDRLFRQSALCREKWVDRPDYRDRTITLALERTSWFYDPNFGRHTVRTPFREPSQTDSGQCFSSASESIAGDAASQQATGTHSGEARTMLAGLHAPPQNLEAELCLIGSLLHEPHRIDDVRATIQADDFYVEIHGVAYQALLTVRDSNRPVDSISFAEELDRIGQFERIGGTDFVIRATEAAVVPSHAEYYAKLIGDKAYAREILAAAAAVSEKVHSHDYSAESLAEFAERTLLAPGDRRMADRVVSIGASATEALRRLGERMAGIRPGLRTGLYEFDGKTGGLQPGHLVVLAARPSLGKTSMALNIVDHVIVEQDRAVLFISLEMTEAELTDRALCGRAEVGGGDFARGDCLTDHDLARLERASQTYQDARLFIADAPAQALGLISSLARRHKARHGISLLVIDYLQLVDPDEAPRQTPRHEVIGKITKKLKDLAKTLNIPILLICQLNREVEKRADKRPQLADLKESGSIEQDANMVLLIHRPEFYDERDRPGEADLIIAKNRGGPTGTIRLRFEKALTKFTSWDEQLPPGHELAAF